MKVNTIRISIELDRQLEQYANVNSFSKNQVVNLALKNLFSKRKNIK